ncbi:MAG: hypothetical protein LAT64_14075 [Phycisphaerales bacterium]|nr:hypothetical protein [Planctomycetota bacterium]MCH8509878.1 hypothetical protein [Phycisphaerales bacterium]
MDTTPHTVEDRLQRLEKSNARWRGLIIALLAGSLGVILGGMAQPRERPDVLDQSHMGYQYVSVGDLIYRIDKFGEISYLNVGDGLRTANGYYGWGRLKVDPQRRLQDRP